MVKRRHWQTTVCLFGMLLGGAVRADAQAGPGEPFDLQACIDTQIQAGRQPVVVPPGRYRVTPRRREHLALRDLADVTIVADGVEMICTETTRALTMERCRNVTLRGLVIDYDPLPYTQGRIVQLSNDSRVHDIELFDGYPPAEQATTFKYEIFRRDTRTLRFGSYYDFTVEATGPRRLRVTKSEAYRGDRWHLEQVGDIIAIGSEYAPGGSIPHAVYLNECANVTLDGVALYASNCFGFFETACDGSTYRRCVIDRRPAAQDFKPRGDARIRSLDADAFHSKHAVRGPALLECVARFQGDDCVNICGDYHMVMAVRGPALRVLAKHRLNIAVGDTVELLTYRGRRLPDAKAVKIEPDGKSTADETAFLARQSMNEGLKTQRGSALRTAWTITLDRAVELPRGSLICSANRIGNGFRVTGCRFGFNRSRGILIKASSGQVTGNTIEAAGMEAVKVAPEYWWLEAGSSNDVQVRDNVIKDCGNGIAIYAYGGPRNVAPAGAHNDIVITGNTLRGTPAPQIRVTSTDGLKITNNTIVGPPDQRDRPEEAIQLEQVLNSTLRDNTIE